jgi:hypothetical protein
MKSYFLFGGTVLALVLPTHGRLRAEEAAPPSDENAALPAAPAVMPADAANEHGIELSGFIDVFHGLDLHRGPDGRRAWLLFNHARDDGFGVNLALIRAAWNHPDVRAAVGLMAGTYVEDNLAAEPPALRHIWEATAGFRLMSNVWVDAGIFESHIGYESAVSTRNPTLTRSLAAENSPYYLAGARIEAPLGPTWTAKLLVTNGWQNIAERGGNRSPGFGTQLVHETPTGFEFNWATFISDETNEAGGGLRLFNSNYIGWRTADVWLVANLDVGVERHDDGWSPWAAGYAIGRFRLVGPLHTALRAEFIADPNGVVAGASDGGAILGAASIGFDVEVLEKAMVRTELRWLTASRRIIDFDDTKWQLGWTTSFAIEFP